MWVPDQSRWLTAWTYSPGSDDPDAELRVAAFDARVAVPGFRPDDHLLQPDAQPRPGRPTPYLRPEASAMATTRCSAA